MSFYLILLSVCQTCRYSGVDFLDFLRSGHMATQSCKGFYCMRGGRFTGADFPGEQADAVMIGQKLQPRLGLIPGLRREQLFRIGLSQKGVFLKPKKVSTIAVTPSPFSA